MEPTKIPCLAKGISAGLWVDLEEAWAFASGTQPAVTCKRAWDTSGGHRRDFLVGCPLVAAAVASWTGGSYLILLLGLILSVLGGHVKSFSTPFGLPLGCLPRIRVGF